MSDAPQPRQPVRLPLMPAFAQQPTPNQNVPETFANQLRMGVTVTDFTLVFGVASDIGAVPVTIDKAIIHVAPGMLKQLLLNLSMAVEAYEEVLGEIKFPRQLVPHLAALKAQLVPMLRQQMETVATDNNTPLTPSDTPQEAR